MVSKSGPPTAAPTGLLPEADVAPEISTRLVSVFFHYFEHLYGRERTLAAARIGREHGNNGTNICTYIYRSKPGCSLLPSPCPFLFALHSGGDPVAGSACRPIDLRQMS